MSKEGTESRLAFVRNYSSRGDDVSTGMTQLKGLRTSNPLECLRLSRLGCAIVVLPCENTETKESRRLFRIPGRVVGLQVPAPVQACAGNIDEVEQNRRAHTSNRPQRSTLEIQA